MTNKKTSFMFVLIGILLVLLATYFAEVYKGDFSALMWFALPLLLIVISCLMFLGGFFYNRFKSEEMNKAKDIQREAVQAAIKKMGGTA